MKFLPEILVDKDDDDGVDILNVTGKGYVEVKSKLKKIAIQEEPAIAEFMNFVSNSIENIDMMTVTVLSCYHFPDIVADLTTLIKEKKPSKQKEINHLLKNIQKFNDKHNDPRTIDLKKLAFMMTVTTSLSPINGLNAIFKTLLFDPKSMMNNYIPSMPHDVQFEVLSSVGREYTRAYNTNVKFFLCPNGHVYGIGKFKSFVFYSKGAYGSL